MSDAPEIQMRLQWAGDFVSPPAAVNQALLVAEMPSKGETSPGAHILTLGFVSPPMIAPDTTPEQLEMLAGQALPVIPVGRFEFTTARLTELRDLIDEHLKRMTATFS